jgi:hypothetical protein
VIDWLHTRDERAQKQAEKKERPPKPVDTEALGKRAAKREAKIDAGIDELDIRLRDLIRSGLAKAQTQPNSFWGTPAARLVDAQAPGLARRVELATIPASGQLAGRSRSPQPLHLLIEGYGGWNLRQRRPTSRTDGWCRIKTKCWRRPGWAIAGWCWERATEEDRLRTAHLVVGTRTQVALILNFAGTQPTGHQPAPSTSVE